MRRCPFCRADKNTRRFFRFSRTDWGDFATPLSLSVSAHSLGHFCREAFEALELERITAMVYAPNIPSRRVLEKNRFSLEGTIRRGAVKEGSIYDVCIYGLLRREAAE